MKRLILFLMLFVVGTIYCESIQQEKLTQYLSDLVMMPTETANKEENSRALQWVENQLSSLGLFFKYQVFEGHPTLVITTKETMAPDIFLVAHIDVVPAPKSLYQPRIVENKMYGRGAYDMKMAIACYLLLFHELKDHLSEMNIGIMLTSDEEIGGMKGVKRLLEAGYSSKVAILPDGGFDWKFEEAAKGVLHLKISAQGISAHGSRPWLGENAIDILIKGLEEVHGYFEMEKQRFGTFYPTVNIGLIQGGKNVNQVPDQAEAKIDIRYPPEIKGSEIYLALVEILSKDPHLTVEIIAEGSPHHVDLKQAPFLKFQEIAKKKYEIDIGKTVSYGSSDARFFGEKNIPVLVIAPKGGDIHSDGEWIDLEDLTRFYNILKQWVVEQEAGN